MTNILVIDGQCKFMYKFARCFDKVRDVNIHIITNKSDSRLDRSKSINSSFYVNHCFDKNLLESINSLIIKLKIDVVFALSEEGIEYLITIEDLIAREARVCILPPKESFVTAKDKALLGKFCRNNSISTPGTLIVSSGKVPDSTEIVELGGKYIVKPVRGSGGEGIKVCNNHSEVITYFQDCASDYEDFVIQEYIEGHDIDCNFFAHKGEIIAYSIQKGFAPGPNPFAPYGGIEFVKDDKVFELARKLVKALKWSGVGHIDMKYDNVRNIPVIIEMNCRYWDTLIGSYLGAKVNFPEMHLNFSLGKSVEFRDFRVSTYVSAKKFFTEKAKTFLGKSKRPISYWSSGFYLIMTDLVYFFHDKLLRKF